MVLRCTDAFPWNVILFNSSIAGLLIAGIAAMARHTAKNLEESKANMLRFDKTCERVSAGNRKTG